MSEIGDRFKNMVRRNDRPDKEDVPPRERKALRTIKKEARAKGVVLASGGEGGLPSSLVLGRFRKAKWMCSRCGETGTKENGGLTIHHKYQHLTAPKEREKGVVANEEGKRNDPSQIAVVCAKCHDAIHERDRAEYGGEDADEEMKHDQKGG